mgnify:CR=1 FL=1
MGLFLIILAMGLVTFLPRVLPVFLLDKYALPPWAIRWLKGVPYAALGALIFPGILTVDPNRPWVGLAGGAAAFLLALLKLPLLAVIGGALLTVILITTFLT